MIDPKTIKTISAQVYRQFPEMAGISPKVRARTTAPEATGKRSSSPTFLLSYTSKVKTSDGNTMPRWVRVVVDENGKIIKITTSR